MHMQDHKQQQKQQTRVSKQHPPFQEKHKKTHKKKHTKKHFFIFFQVQNSEIQIIFILELEKKLNWNCATYSYASLSE